MLVLVLLSCIAWSPAEVRAYRIEHACRIACAGDEVRGTKPCRCGTVGGLEWRP